MRADPVQRRQVFYIPGFDPFPPRRYRELYRREGPRQAAISGYEIEVRGRPGAGGIGWHAKARIGGHTTQARFEVLTWSDIVRDRMRGGVLTIYLHLVRTAWTYISTGALMRLARLRKGPLIAALYPVAMLFLQLLLAGAAGWAGGRLVAATLHPQAFWAGFLLVPPILEAFRRQDPRLYAWYLLADYACAAERRGAYTPELEERIRAFADRIAASIESGDADEVLIVGHSSGAQLAISALADLVRQGRVPQSGLAVSLLTLGQVVPMVSFLPGATRLRADLQLLSEDARITWVDVSAPGDGASFALCDPVAVSGVARPGRKRWPLVISAAFSLTLAPETKRALRFRFLRLHAQYLCAFDRPRDYDYFQITAGPMTLAERYAGRPASRSRIERAISGHRTVAA